MLNLPIKKTIKTSEKNWTYPTPVLKFLEVMDQYDLLYNNYNNFTREQSDEDEGIPLNEKIGSMTKQRA